MERNDRAQNEKDTVLVLGAGRMGVVHIRALENIARPIFAKQGRDLEIVVVEREQERLDKLPESIARRYTTVSDALADGVQPTMVLQAFNDDQHYDAFKTLERDAPGIKAILSEKPLVETTEQVKDLEDFFAERYLSLNTVIHFSNVFPVFDEAMKNLAVDGAPPELLGVEAVWGKDRTQDTRPTIGVPSESVHALGIVSDMLGVGNVALESGTAHRGYLSAKATDVIYETDTVFRSEKNVPLHFHCSYVLPEQHRRITSYYKTADGALIAAEMEFDLKDHEKKNVDTLNLYKVDAQSGTMEKIFSAAPEPGDKISAYIGQSCDEYLNGVQSPGLSHVETAASIQTMIEDLQNAKEDHTILEVTLQDAHPDYLHAVKYPRLEDVTPEARVARIASLGIQAYDASPVYKKDLRLG